MLYSKAIARTFLIACVNAMEVNNRLGSQNSVVYIDETKNISFAVKDLCLYISVARCNTDWKK